MSIPEHKWFLPGLSIEHAATEAERLDLLMALGKAGRLESFLYDAVPGTSGLLDAWRALTHEGWVFALRYAGPCPGKQKAPSHRPDGPKTSAPADAAENGDPGLWSLRGAKPAAPATPRLCAVIVLTGFTGKAAFFHFCLLPGFEPFWVPMGRDMISWLFESGRIVCLLGFTPVCYRHVRGTLPRFGFVPQFTAPEACFIRRRNRHADGLISMCTPQSFAEAVHKDPE